jgi:hypothetical protein
MPFDIQPSTIVATRQQSRQPGATRTGYAHPSYAAALWETGTPRDLPESGGSILQRSIDGFTDLDGMGSYPLFACRDWSGLGEDLAGLEGDLVALSMVTDPFGDYREADLWHWFEDRVVPFKEHFVVDLSASPKRQLHPHHRRNVAKARRYVAAERCTDPVGVLDEWVALYANLVRRHRIRGVATFSKRSFAMQLRVPGLVAFRAVDGAETIGMTLWYATGDVAYYHLGAYSERGYEVGASFALFSHAIEHFAAVGLAWLDLGAGAGLDSDRADGLARFKRGWSTGTRTAYFCGRVFSPDRYAAIAEARAARGSGYFPAYREGEFA